MAQDPDALEVAEPPKGEPQNQTEQAPQDTLLTMEEPAVCERLIQDFNESYRYVKNYVEIGKLNRARELGYIGARLVKIQDESRFWVPPGAQPNSGAAMNKIPRLKRRVRATIFSDAPVPECTPFTDTDEDRDKAEFSTRVLQFLTGPSGLAYALKAGNAFDLGSNWGSGYVEFFRNPNGGGWVPQAVMVAPEAQQLEGAIDAQGMPVIVGTDQPYPGDPVEKYVMEDGSLTDDPNVEGVKRVWRSSIESQLHTLKNVRLIPSTAEDIWDADGVQVGRLVPWGQLKTEIPKLATLDEETKQKILDSKPEHARELTPPSRRGYEKSKGEDETLVFDLKRYHYSCALYPKGAYLRVLGTEYLCEREEWWDQRRRRPKLLPVTQFKQYSDGEPGENPNGSGVTTDIGPGGEARGIMLGTLFDHLDKFRKRKTFAPYTSNVRAEQMQSDAATFIPVLNRESIPIPEELPEFPSSVEKMYEMASLDMDDASGLQQGGQASNAPSVKSGLHAQQIQEQINVLLSEPKQNTDRGLVRGWEIVLQLAAEMDTPQQISWVGEDGAYKQETWTGADIGNTQDVQIHKGSFTMLSPSSKAALTQSLQAAQLIDAEDARSAVTGNVGGLINLQDNPHRLRVRRQIAQWNEGPPPDWAPQKAPVDETGQPVVDPNTNQPVPAPPDPVLGKIFDARPPDDEPDVARVRMYELGRAIASGKYNRWAEYPAWQQGILASYEQAKAASQILDAEASAKLQEDAQAAQQKVAETEAKLAAKPTVSLALKSAFELDQAQTVAFAAQAGVELPPGGVMEPQLDPNVEMQTQAALQERQIGADVEKHRTTESAKVERERVKAAAKVEKQARKPAAAPQPLTVQVPGMPEQAAGMAQVAETVKALTATTAALQKAVLTPKRAVRDKDGKIVGAEPVSDG